jgi:hypothetical protein
MPNLWSTAKQKISELFKGPRTKDIDFDAKVEQLKRVHESVSNLKYVYHNFHKNTKGK